ncbi:hypothetical protein B7Y94_03615 [Candidatus Saccharibacteria bacterium 32-49-12]|nr:MAG: hypothetical protein B7Y94_03615 [Candidatus Saccharibacteria bacterium 32-49-12]
MLNKTQINLKRLVYRLRRDYLTLNNIVVVVALFISLNWTWNSIEVMQQNYQLQQSVDAKRQQVALESLRVDTLELESKYYTTLEYQELAVRERLGKAMPGEHVVIVPSTEKSTNSAGTNRRAASEPSNLQQWRDFLFGGPRDLQN